MATPLPPLNPDAFLAWEWRACGGKGRPMTTHEWWLAFYRESSLSLSDLRREITLLAVTLRKQERLRRLAKKRGSELWERKG